MSSAPTAPPKDAPPEPSMLGAGLSYLIPGLGQIYQQRYAKGALFMVSLLGMFMVGQSMGQWQNVYIPREDGGGHRSLVGSLVLRWHYAGQFWIGVAAWPALSHYYGPPPRDVEENPSFWRRYQRPPGETQLNEFIVNSDRTPDLGWVYTVIAGMLNILVIYDAYAGPMILAVPTIPRKAAAPQPTMESKKEAVA